MDDVPLLMGFFLKKFNSPDSLEIGDAVMDAFMAYDYPGNVRELKSIVRSAVNLAQGKPININCLPTHIRQKARKQIQQARNQPIPTLAELEKTHIINVYHMNDNNKAESARILGIGINTLRRKLKAYGVK